MIRMPPVNTRIAITMTQSTAPKASPNERAPIAGEAFLRALADHGIDYFFANPGTDFPPVVEAFSRAKKS
ncbi:MAG: hypothetical protein J0H89_02060, partial [Rhizobiales bacterium]|nr:hypothetical protein [Hyphomicrobiales bacterium]